MSVKQSTQFYIMKVLHIVSLLFFFYSVAFSQSPFTPTPPGIRVVVDKTAQVLEVMDGDLVQFRCPCGTGTEAEDCMTPEGTYKITSKEGPEAKSAKYGSPMPYRMKLDDTGIFIHGSPGFIKLKGAEYGVPQSHGCIRVSTKDAIEIQKLVKIGTKVEIKGSIKAFIAGNEVISKLFESKAGEYRLKILSDPSPENIRLAREAFFNGTLLVKGKKGSNNVVVGYPFLPPSSRVSAAQFQDIVLTTEEKAAGKCLIRVE